MHHRTSTRRTTFLVRNKSVATASYRSDSHHDGAYGFFGSFFEIFDRRLVNDTVLHINTFFEFIIISQLRISKIGLGFETKKN